MLGDTGGKHSVVIGEQGGYSCAKVLRKWQWCQRSAGTALREEECMGDSGERGIHECWWCSFGIRVQR